MNEEILQRHEGVRASPDVLVGVCPKPGSPGLCAGARAGTGGSSYRASAFCLG